MATRATKVTCLVCGGALERGFVLDRGESNRRHVQEWWSGDPQSSFWMGIKKPETLQGGHVSLHEVRLSDGVRGRRFNDMDVAVQTIAFYTFAGLALGSALGVVISTNIVRTAIFLLGTLASAAGLYFLLDANLLAAIQLIVYAGGTLVLIIFGIMLTSKSPWIKYNPTRGQILGAIVVGLLLAVGLCSLLLGADWQSSGTLTESPKVAAAGKALLTDYLVPFEAASVLLLVVMIAAAYLARPEK